MAKKVTMYTTSSCPHCIRAKSLLKNKNIAFNEIDITDDQAKRDELLKKTGWMTVPVILIDQELIGGADELYALEEKGELDSKFA